MKYPHKCFRLTPFSAISRLGRSKFLSVENNNPLNTLHGHSLIVSHAFVLEIDSVSPMMQSILKL